MTPDRILRKRLDKNSRLQGECLVWLGSKSPHGFGRIHIKGRMWSTHRVAYTLHYGEIPPGLLVLHYCDNPACLRIEHLYTGTWGHIMQYHAERGQINQRGERNSRSKLTNVEVCELRELYRSGTSARELAQRFHIARETVYSIVRGKNWKHLKHEPIYRGYARGIKIVQAKLTDDHVREIRRRYRPQVYSTRRLAQEFGVSQSTIHQIISYGRWKHVTERRAWKRPLRGVGGKVRKQGRR